VLAAMRVDREIAASTIRVSLGWSSSEADIEHLLRAWSALYRRCRGLVQRARAA
jgi:cysteine desulfurase